MTPTPHDFKTEVFDEALPTGFQAFLPATRRPLIEIWGRQLETDTSRQDIYDAVGLITQNGELVPDCAAGDEKTGDMWLYNSLQGLFHPDQNRYNAAEGNLRRHLSQRGNYGMSGPFDFGGIITEGFSTFQRTKFGTKVPAYYLDPGIALFIKTLSFLGVHTVYSCCGHGKECPHFSVHGRWHYAWVKACLSRLFPDQQFLWEQNPDGSWMSYKVKLDMKGNEAYWSLAKMGRYLIDHPGVCAQVRELKHHPKMIEIIHTNSEILTDLFRSIPSI